MICDQIAALLSELVDGTLDPLDRTKVEEHLDRCASCRATLADLRAICRAAATLDRQMPPESLWPRIGQALLLADRSERSTITESAATSELSPGWTARAGRARLALAAAAVLVMMAIGGLWVRETQPSRSSGETGRTAKSEVQRQTAPPPRGSDSSATDTAVEPENVVAAVARDYEKAIVDLEQIVRSGSEALDPDVAATLNRNIAVVDDAIGETRRALATDPEGDRLRTDLLEAFDSKIELLEQMVVLITEMREGTVAQEK